MTLRIAAVLLVLLGGAACGPTPTPAVSAGTAAPEKAALSLEKPIGITTAGGVFTPLIPAGQTLPTVQSQTFGNKTDGGSQVGVVLSQKGSEGIETVASMEIDVPPAANDAVGIIVTLTVSESKQMTVKTTVVKTAKIQQFGPFPVQ